MLLAALEGLASPPATVESVRAAVRSAFIRTWDLRLTAVGVVEALAPPLPPEAAPASPMPLPRPSARIKIRHYGCGACERCVVQGSLTDATSPPARLRLRTDMHAGSRPARIFGIREECIMYKVLQLSNPSKAYSGGLR